MKLEQGVKLRNAEPSDIENLLTYLFTLVDMKAPTDEAGKVNHLKQVIVLHDLLKTSFKNDTIEEIKEAFKMALSGQLDVELYQKIDSISLGRVMRLYRKHKANKLVQYRREQISMQKEQVEVSEEKKKEIRREFLEICLYKPYESLLKGVWNFTEANLSHLYTIFKELNLIEITSEEKSEYKEMAKEILTNRLNAPTNSSDRIIFKIKLKALNEGGNGWQHIAKGLVVKEYLQGWALNNDDIKKIVK